MLKNVKPFIKTAWSKQSFSREHHKLFVWSEIEHSIWMWDKNHLGEPAHLTGTTHLIWTAP